jgi:hypothetical protein
MLHCDISIFRFQIFVFGIDVKSIHFESECHRIKFYRTKVIVDVHLGQNVTRAICQGTQGKKRLVEVLGGPLDHIEA